MKFQINGIEYDTNKYIMNFVDENTGELSDRKVLNKSVRLLWFRSVYPKARIEKEIVSAGLPKEILTTLPNGINDMSKEVWNYIQKIASRGIACAIAKAEIYESANSEKPMAVDYAVRYAERGFTYNNEAALNAAADRAIATLGFIVPEEIATEPEIFANELTDNIYDDYTKKAGNAIAGIEKLIDEDRVPTDSANSAKKPSANKSNDGTCYDKATPVEDIVKMMSETDARSYVVTRGRHAGKTVGEMYEETKDNKGHSKTLEFFVTTYTGSDNILRAACQILNK